MAPRYRGCRDERSERKWRAFRKDLLHEVSSGVTVHGVHAATAGTSHGFRSTNQIRLGLVTEAFALPAAPGPK
jgi:hypothetical protein